MKKFIVIIIFILFSFAQNIHAQINIGLSFGGGFFSSSLNNTKLPYWEDGYLISMSGDYNITEDISLFFNSTYQQHYFKEELVTLAVPDIYGYRYSINGENSSVFDLSIGSKFYVNTSRIKPYLSAGVGVLLINQGKVEISHWIEGETQKNTNLFANTNKNYNLARYNFGFGIEYEIVNNLNLILDSKLIYSINGPSYIPITFLIKFGI